MPLVLPVQMDQEDIEKFIILTAAALPATDMAAVDRQDYERVVRDLVALGKTRIDDGDIVSELRAAAGTVA